MSTKIHRREGQRERQCKNNERERGRSSARSSRFDSTDNRRSSTERSTIIVVGIKLPQKLSSPTETRGAETQNVGQSYLTENNEWLYTSHWKVLDEKAKGTFLKLNLCVVEESFNNISGVQEEEAQSDPAEAEPVEEGAVSKSSSSQDKEDLDLMRTGSNSEDLMLFDFEKQTGKDCPV
ncbi:unnamed protein product [Ceratitis capitata]|uniref:(Mediterranean fruit fly) hypothetical protein n=1 Tax=Ceratitis capitata TaxID=7213 RepID=A0A811VHH6_CERCA|nr:unnamed protein product [Ceratitis capitata]